MSFIVADFQDLARILEERPEWRRELRRLLFTDELLALPEQAAELRATTERRFQELAEAQQRTTEQLQVLADSHLRLEKRFEDLGDTLHVLVKDMGEVKGKLL